MSDKLVVTEGPIAQGSLVNQPIDGPAGGGSSILLKGVMAELDASTRDLPLTSQIAMGMKKSMEMARITKAHNKAVADGAVAIIHQVVDSYVAQTLKRHFVNTANEDAEISAVLFDLATSAKVMLTNALFAKEESLFEIEVQLRQRFQSKIELGKIPEHRGKDLLKKCDERIDRLVDDFAKRHEEILQGLERQLDNTLRTFEDGKRR